MNPGKICFFVLIALAATLAGTAHAQLQVTLKMSRALYMTYEPMLAEVSITNLSGRDLNLADAPGQSWFGFEVFAGKDTLLPPVNPHYRVDPIYIPAGQTLKRTLNLTPLYPLQDFGPHSLRAVIYDKETDKYYSSNRKAIEITDGVQIWTQTVGATAAQGGGNRTISLLTNRLLKENRLYVRIMNPDTGVALACFSLGRVLSFSPPEYTLDDKNQLNVLQMVGPRQYFYTQIDANGKILQRTSYIDDKTSPKLSREDLGFVVVKGGKLDTPEARAAEQKPRANLPKLSDRPIGAGE